MRDKPTMFEKVLMPHLLLIIAMFLIVLVVVNVSLSTYSLGAAKAQINDTFKTVRLILKEQLSSLSESSPEKALNKSLNNAMRIIRQTAHVELVVLQPGTGWLIPSDIATGPVPPELLERIAASDAANTDELETARLERIGSERFLVSGFTLTKNPKVDSGPLRIYLIASLNTVDSFTRRLNILFIATIFTAMAVSLIVAAYVAKNLSKPLQNAAAHATSIHRGNYHRIYDEPATKEIEDLYISLNSMCESLERSEREQEDYFQNLSHDLRTPLTSIQGYAEGIRAGIFEANDQAADIIATESIRLKLLVDELLTLSRLESSQRPPQSVPVEMRTFMDSAMARLYTHARDKGISMVLSCPEQLVVAIDEKLLETIVTNLSDNALRYARHSVLLDVNHLDKALTVTIRDDGPGIAPEVLAKLFERFNKGRDGHQGLGLAIVKSAAEKLQGQVWADSNSFGATFYVTVPCDKLSE